MFRRILVVIAISLTLAAPAQAAVSVQSGNGSSITITKKIFTDKSKVMVVGKNFDETVGIYLAYCVLPKKGQAPTPCGGGVNKSGIGEASYWISSNPPPYGIGLAIPYVAGGRFKEELVITRKIGKFDCKKVRCAITVRSDHLHEGDRTHDIFIPITIR